jgi:hypothetical protein
VGVFLGHGDGTLGTKTTYSFRIGSSPIWIALGDVNNDKQLDIVTANQGSKTINFLFGKGDGTFTMTNYSFSVSYATPYSVVVGNVNSDNHLDMIVAYWEGAVAVFLGNSDGNFTKLTSYLTGGNIFSIALANLNGDNHLDFIVANPYSSNVGVFLGYGNGTFVPQAIYSTGSASQPYYVIVADFNNDNISDIAATNEGSDQVVIFYGFGNGSFELRRVYSTGFGSKPYGITVTDFNDDKQLEIIVAL